MSRRLARLTLDNLGDLPRACRSCLFWELDPVRRQRAADAGEARAEKEAWVSRCCWSGAPAAGWRYVDDEPAGYVLYAPAVYLPGRRRVPDRAGQRGRGAAGDRDGLPRVRRRRARPGADADRREGPGQARRHPGDGGVRRHPRPPGAATRRATAAACCRPTTCCGWASRPTGRTRATRGCAWSCARRSPGATRSRARWSGCSAPYARRGTRPPTRPTGWAGCHRTRSEPPPA